MIARLADVNLALYKRTRQISTIFPARKAVDGDLITASCTLDTAGHPWWSVDLGQRYYIGRVTITFPDVRYVRGTDLRNYHRFCFVLLTRYI